MLVWGFVDGNLVVCTEKSIPLCYFSIDGSGFFMDFKITEIMAIRLTLEKTQKSLFCESKWWGDPDMPADASYPMMKVCEMPDGSSFLVRPGDDVSGGEVYDYPLTFICQIRCEDIAELDPENRLPHEGMLYFFAAMDEYTGYDSPVHMGMGEWPKGSVAVKYTKSINMESFQACMMVDEDGQSLTEPALGISFEACDDAADGIKLLGAPFFCDAREQFPGYSNLLQIDENETAGTTFYDTGMLNFLVSDADFAKGLLKRPVGVLCSL